MEHDAAHIADLRAVLAVMRRELDESSWDQISLSTPELNRLREEIANREQVLRDLRIEDP